VTELDSIRLSSNSLTGPIPTEIGLLTALSSLVLGGNFLNSTIPTQLGLLTELDSIILSNSKLTGSIPTEIGLLTALTWLVLWSNSLNSTIPMQLGLLTKLEAIFLSDNKLTGKIPTELGLLSALTSLELRQNQLSGNLPSEVCELQPSNDLAVAVDCQEVSCGCNCTCEDPCLMPREALSNCVEDNQGNFGTCLSCVNSYPDGFFPLNASMCTAFERYLCTEVGACPSCGPCIAKYVAWMNCVLNGTCSPFACPGPAPLGGNASAPGLPSGTPPSGAPA
jgi:hypothetical protein